jgi:hypothetical protein
MTEAMWGTLSPETPASIRRELTDRGIAAALRVSELVRTLDGTEAAPLPRRGWIGPQSMSPPVW